MVKYLLTTSFLICIAVYVNAQIPTAGLIAYYPFNNNANDENPNNPGAHNGTLFGAIPTADRDGNTNSAYEFDGVNDYIQVNTTNFGNNFTISLWVNPHQRKNYMEPISSEKKFGFVHYADGHFVNAIGTGSSWMPDFYISPIDFYDINTWYHLVLIYDGAVLKAYKDNVLLGTKNYALSNLTTQFNIGSRYRSTGNIYYFDGFIDDIRIYNVALDAIGINALYNEGSTPPPGGPSLWTENNGKIYYNSGNVGIGITNPPAKLTVNGAILGTQIKVKTDVSTFPDFVFEPDYPLMTITEVDNYIQTHGHLPDIPTAQEAVSDGHDIGAMNLKLLQKIEELTLYAIEQECQIDALRISNGELKISNDERDRITNDLLPLKQENTLLQKTVESLCNRLSLLEEKLKNIDK